MPCVKVLVIYGVQVCKISCLFGVSFSLEMYGKSETTQPEILAGRRVSWKIRDCLLG